MFYWHMLCLIKNVVPELLFGMLKDKKKGIATSAMPFFLQARIIV
jgi:hypothetical protein